MDKTFGKKTMKILVKSIKLMIKKYLLVKNEL